MNFLLAIGQLFEQRLKDASLIAGTVVIVLSAITVLVKIARNSVKNIAEWFKQETSDIIKQELIKASFEGTRAAERNGKVLILCVSLLKDIKETVSELLPNGGSHFRDTFDELNQRVKEMYDDGK